MSFTTRLIRSLLLCALFCASSLVSFTHALGVKFTSPAPGATLPPGQFTVSWEDAGGTPGLSDLTTYNLALWVGGNTASNSKSIITSLGTPDASVQSLSLVVDLPTDVAQSIQNGFYLCMTSNTSTGNQVINYSNRFTLINLNGTTDQQYVAGAASTVGDANVPSAYYNNTIATPPISSTATTSSATTTPTASETPSSGSSSSDDQGYTIGGGALVGLLVGTLSAIILLLVLLTLGLIWWRRRRRARREQEKEEEQTDAEIWAGDKTELPDRNSRAPAMRAVPLVELSPDQERFEAMTPVEAHEADSEIRYELEGDWAGWEAAARRSKAYDPTL